jgi:hypothetical protein
MLALGQVFLTCHCRWTQSGLKEYFGKAQMTLPDLTSTKK